MMNKTTEALKMAIECMKWLRVRPDLSILAETEAEKLCKEALESQEVCTNNPSDEEKSANASQEQEPICAVQDGEAKWYYAIPENGTLLYTHPAPSQEQAPVAWMMVHRPPHEGAAYLTFEKPTREQKISHHPYELYTHPAQPLSEWISVKDRMPDYIEGKDYSENVLAMYSVGENTSYMGIFNLVIVEYTEDGHQWAWGKLDSCYSDIRDSEPEWDDDYEVTHWMPLPNAPQAHGIGVNKS